MIYGVDIIHAFQNKQTKNKNTIFIDVLWRSWKILVLTKQTNKQLCLAKLPRPPTEPAVTIMSFPPLLKTDWKNDEKKSMFL